MNFRRSGAILGTATAVVAGIAFANPASASIVPPGGGWDHTWTTTDAAHGGTIYVEEHGDIVELCDTAADGISPSASIDYGNKSGSYSYVLEAKGGNGTCVSAQAGDGKPNHNILEDVDVTVKIWLGSGSYSATHVYWIDL